MALFSGLFDSKEKHPQLDRIAESMRAHHGLQLTPPPEDIIRVLDQMTSRELRNFENVHSVEGLQELFRAKSIRVVIDRESQAVSLVLAAGVDLEHEIQQQHAERKVLRVGEHRAVQSIILPKAPAQPLQAMPLGAPATAAPAAPLPAAFEHLEATERLFPQLVDLFLKHGRVTTGDKEVLKRIRPADGTLEARIAALEKWQAELNHRVRGLHVPKAAAQMILPSAESELKAKPDEGLTRRFDAILVWTSKLIKALEHTGVKFHAKPMWLPR